MNRIIACTFLALAVLAGCGRTVSVVDPDTSIQLSGRWNDEDSRIVANGMIDEALSKPWVTNFRDHSGRAPIIRISQVINGSTEEIATGVFTDNLSQALINSGRVRVVASRSEAELQRDERSDLQGNSAPKTAPKSYNEQAPDFLLQGTIKIQNDHAGRKTVKFYQVDLKLIDVTTNEVVWIGEVKRKKVVDD